MLEPTFEDSLRKEEEEMLEARLLLLLYARASCS